jgi:DNA polymerase-3 subunit alpha
MLDGSSHIEDLILCAKELGQTAIAITDHGSTSGLYEAYQMSLKHDFKVILGSEFYFDNNDGERRAGHLILLAKNQIGLENLYKLQKFAYMDNFFYKPRINMSILKECSEGLICTSACMANKIAQLVLVDENTLALQHIKELQSIFGNDFYLELQSSTQEEQIKINKKYIEFYNDYNIPLIITNDVHYTRDSDWETHEVLLAIQTNQKMNDPKRFTFPTHEYWLKSESEIYEPVKEYLPDYLYKQMCLNIEQIIFDCNAVIESGNYLPKYKGMSDVEEVEYLTTLIKDNKSKEVWDELEVVCNEGYAGYFLIVQEYINWARANGVLVGNGRGSVAGSRLAFALAIHGIRPEKYGLLFERFLSPGRTPDIDVDFSDLDAMFKHLQDEYGPENCARVGAFARLTPKACIRKVMSSFGYTMKQIGEAIKMLPDRLDFTLDDACTESTAFEAFVLNNNEMFRHIFKLENVISHMSTHAGGVVICQDLYKKLPITRDKDDNSKLVIGYDKNILDSLGHYKFDILGLSNLNMVQNCLESIEEDVILPIEELNDSKVYDLLCKGDVSGVFQLSEQAHAVIEQQPRCFEDLIALNALIRPGTGDWNQYIRRRNGLESFILPTIRQSYMNETEGLIVYQEQYLIDCLNYAHWDIAWSDKYVRKCKDILHATELREKFIEDSTHNGFELFEIQTVWDDISNAVASGYGFNKAHATSYAVLSYQTAWLKTYYPVEFYASLMSQDSDDSDKLTHYITECNKKNIKILPPHINDSVDYFKPIGNSILYQLNSIIGLGGSSLTEVKRLRPILSLEDFITRRTPKFIKITTIENMIKSGCFDFENTDRTMMLNRAYLLMGKSNTYSEHPNYIYEKESLGLYLSSSPLDNLDIEDISMKRDDSVISTAGEVLEVVKRIDKNGNEMAFVTIANKYGKHKLLIFSTLYKQVVVKEGLVVGNLIIVNAKKSKGSLLVNTISVWEGAV